MNLQSKGTGSSLFAAGDVKITTGSLSDYFFVGATAVEIGEALGINSVSGSDYVGVSFGAEAFLKQSGTNSVGKEQEFDTGAFRPTLRAGHASLTTEDSNLCGPASPTPGSGFRRNPPTKERT